MINLKFIFIILLIILILFLIFKLTDILFQQQKSPTPSSTTSPPISPTPSKEEVVLPICEKCEPFVLNTPIDLSEIPFILSQFSGPDRDGTARLASLVEVQDSFVIGASWCTPALVIDSVLATPIVEDQVDKCTKVVEREVGLTEKVPIVIYGVKPTDISLTNTDVRIQTYNILPWDVTTNKWSKFS